MLAEHRVLTTTHLTALAFPSPRAAQLRLATLYQLGVIDRFQPLTPVGSVPMHWVIDTPGLAVLAAEDNHPPGAGRHRHRRGAQLAVAHSNQLAHLLGVNTCLTTLAAKTPAGAGGGGWLGLWWSQARATRHFGDYTRPDAYAHWHTPRPATATHTDTATGTATGTATDSGRPGPLVWALFFEYDRGSEPAHQLAAKLAGYHQLAAATAISTPVLFWLPTPARETAARRALGEARTALAQPHLVPLATTHPISPHHHTGTGTRGGDLGPDLAGPVWLPLTRDHPHPPQPTPTPAAGSGSGRLSLDQLAAHLPIQHHHAGHTGHTGFALSPRAGLARAHPAPRGGEAAELTAPAPHPPPPSEHPAQHRTPPGKTP
jgi:hypothetical protein